MNTYLNPTFMLTAVMSNHPWQALAIAAVATIIVCGGGGETDTVHDDE